MVKESIVVVVFGNVGDIGGMIVIGFSVYGKVGEV